MARGHPDYGASGAISTIASVQDLGELAARLGSIVTFDRRGNVILADSFEDTLSAWSNVTTGTGASVAQSNDSARSGQYSAKLVTGNLNGDYAYISGVRSIAVLGKLGLEVSFNGPSSTERWTIGLQLFTGAKQVIAQATIEGASTAFTIVTTGGVTHELTLPYALYVGTKSFHTLKLVADFSAQTWTRLLLDSNSYDLSALGLYVLDSSTLPALNAQIQLTALSDASKTRYVDDVIITQNEL